MKRTLIILIIRVIVINNWTNSYSCKVQRASYDRWSPEIIARVLQDSFIGKRWSRRRKPNWVSSPWVSDVVRHCRRYLRVWASWYELRVCRITRRGPWRGHGGPTRLEITDHLYSKRSKERGNIPVALTATWLLCCMSDRRLIGIRNARRWVYHILSNTVSYCDRLLLTSLDVLGANLQSRLIVDIGKG